MYNWLNCNHLHGSRFYNFNLEGKMTQEEKQILSTDLCARLMHRVKCFVPVENCIMELTGKRLNYFCFHKEEWGYDYSREFEVVLDPLNDSRNRYIVKPYLRPMSSMTDEEKKELKSATCPEGTGYFNEQYIICPMSHSSEHISYDFMSDILNWLNAHHFDYRGLIPKGLAIEVTEENNPYKE